ncbi:MAG TPA: DUF2752 domain-containing protein [Actinomycetales bacterium]|nr:DUF2752 domain-containing protein [Actinomycetales bacterium]
MVVPRVSAGPDDAVRGGWASRSAVPLATAASAVAALALVASVDPNEPGHYPTCPFLALTGWFCPGCGSLRALHALAHGDVREALARNPLMVLTVPVLVVWWVGWLLRTVRAHPRRRVAPAWSIWALLVVVIAFGIVRNLPGGAFLAP